MTERILILGGTGYLGSRLAYDLANDGYGVSVLGRFDPRPAYPAWSSLMDEVILGDVRDAAILERLVEADYDAFVNLVSLGPRQSNISPATAFAVDVLPTWHLLQRAAGRRLRRCIYVSTTRVLDGAPPGDAGTARPSVAPISQYALTHALAEQIVDYFHRTSKVDAIAARLASSFGSPLFRETGWKAPVINQFCCMAHEDGAIRLASDGLARRDFVHVHDLSRFVRIALAAVSLPNSLYTVASGHTWTIRSAAYQVAQALQARTGQQIPVLLPNGQTCDPPDAREMQDQNRPATAALESIRFEPRMRFIDGVNEVLDYLMDTRV